MHPGKIVCTFGLGSKATYGAIHDNPDISCQPVDKTNLPHLIIQNDRLMSINNTTQMDLQGQAASESNWSSPHQRHRGQLQFVRGAYASNGGKSFLCMSSTYERNGDRRSRIVLNLTPGNIVTAPRTDMMFVVTECGLVNLKGKSVPERGKAMISLAHPDFRDDLEREARTNGLIPRSFVRTARRRLSLRNQGRHPQRGSRRDRRPRPRSLVLCCCRPWSPITHCDERVIVGSTRLAGPRSRHRGVRDPLRDLSPA